jgi:type 1 glutamine amidotransferase
MRKYVVAAGVALALGLSLAPVPGQTPAAPKKIEILFLGHNSVHHDSAKFEPMLKTALASEPFNFTYTADPKDLNEANLAKYDELIIYANHTNIEPDQEKALLDFVAGGKGFLPLHCASFCFQNSPQYIALVGAQFQRHKTGEFIAEVVKPDHPVMLSIQPFNVWDETYVHTKHNNDRTVLMERVDAEGREPWTWVRTHGKGRVFYTAYGHDERVWGHPSFHRLVRNAILWAAPTATRAQMKIAPERELAAALGIPADR